jgi:hypothetical protein
MSTAVNQTSVAVADTNLIRLLLLPPLPNWPLHQNAFRITPSCASSATTITCSWQWIPQQDTKGHQAAAVIPAAANATAGAAARNCYLPVNSPNSQAQHTVVIGAAAAAGHAEAVQVKRDH